MHWGFVNINCAQTKLQVFKVLCISQQRCRWDYHYTHSQHLLDPGKLKLVAQFSQDQAYPLSSPALPPASQTAFT